MRRGARFAIALFACVMAWRAEASAQMARSSLRAKPQARSRSQASPANDSLKARTGFAVAARLVRSEHEETRLQGLERLGQVGSPQALELLTKALEPSGAARSSRERLTAVRALAPHAKVPAVRALLGRVAVGVGSSGERSDELDALVRDTALLIIARSGETEDLELLGKALRQPGRLSESAGAALLAYPPRELGPLLKGRFAPTRELVRVLGELGDQRAFLPLREFVKRGAPEIRAEAALSLTRLGAFETVELARHWLRSERQPALLEAAARILATARAPEASAAIESLLASKDGRAQGLALAFETGLPELVPALSHALASAQDEQERVIVAALGRARSDAAVAELERALSSAERAPLAAHALALHPSDAASEALSRALRGDRTRRDALRAAVVRKLALGIDVRGVKEALDALSASREPADRAVFGFARAALDPGALGALLRERDPLLVRAAARAVLVSGNAAPLAERLVHEQDALTRAQLAVALAFEAGRARVPTSTLFELLESGSPSAPLAALAIAGRDSEILRPRVEALLASGDPLVRAHAALGLGVCESPTAVGLLERAYRFEPDRTVRRAIVVGLSQRSEATRRRPLKLAAELDPDATVRQAARLAHAGHALSPLPLGVTSAWLEVESRPAADGEVVPVAMIGQPGGAVIPAVADPDGRIVVPGLGSGPLVVRLAAATVRDNASGAKTK